MSSGFIHTIYGWYIPLYTCISCYIYRMYVQCGAKLLQSCPTLCNSVQPYGLSPIGLLCPWDFPDKNTGAGCMYICKIHVSGFFFCIWGICLYIPHFIYPFIHWWTLRWFHLLAEECCCEYWCTDVCLSLCFGGGLSQKLSSTGGHREQLALSFLIEKTSVAEDKRDFY